MAATIDESYRYLAAKYVRKQARQLATQLKGVRKAEDIECVHQARVASRRLRAALGMFDGCFRAKRVKRWRRQIRRVTAGLGAARDADVQIEYLCSTLAATLHKDHTLGIARLLTQCHKRRAVMQAATVAAVDRLQRCGLLDDMKAATKDVVSCGKARRLSVRSPVAYRRTAEHILRRCDRLLDYQDCLADPEDRRRHHAMRIAAKRLRYTLEIAKPVYGGGLAGYIVAVKKVQALLGDVHDCDLWEELLLAFAAQQRRRIVKRYGGVGPFAQLGAGIEFLRLQRKEERRKVFQELVQYWQELRQNELWESLAYAVRRCSESPNNTLGTEEASAETAWPLRPARPA